MLFNLENILGEHNLEAKIMKSLEICQFKSKSLLIHEIKCLQENKFDIKYFHHGFCVGILYSFIASCMEKINEPIRN